jgi:thiamine-phosphate pyrophosphorylase
LSVSLPRLCAIVDTDAAARAGWPAADLAKAFLDGGARFLQIRAKQLASGPFLELCDAVVALAQQVHGIVIVNDRVDLARMSGAAGVHVGQEDLAPSLARAQLGEAAVIGYSTHTLAQLEAAAAEPVTYTAVGPIFGSVTKDTGYDAVGLGLVREAARIAAGRPVVAIGGIRLDNAASVIAAGATSVAVIGDLLREDAPDARVRAFLKELA